MCFALEPAAGCSARVSAQGLEVRSAAHAEPRVFPLWVAAGVLSGLLDFARASPGTRQVRASIGPARLPALYNLTLPPEPPFPPWSFDRRRIWITAADNEVTIQVRAASEAIDDEATDPEPLATPAA